MSDEGPAVAESPAVEDAPILAALDFTADSEAALLWACQYGVSVNAPVIALHVVHDPSDEPGYYRKAEQDLLRPLEDIAGEMMESFLQRMRREHPEETALEEIESVLVKGIPATRILEIAEARAVRMIVMGSRGRTGLPHLLLGSKAERVAQLAPVPVTIVKAENRGA